VSKHFNKKIVRKTKRTRQRFPRFFIGIFFFGNFSLRLRKRLGKSEDVSNKVPTRYDWLSKRNARRDHPSARSTQKMFTDKINKN